MSRLLFKQFAILVQIAVLGLPMGFAKENQLTITTFYPHPYGIYKDLKTKKLSAGDMGPKALADAPEGQLLADKSIIFSPVNLTAADLPDPREGELVYSGNTFYYWDGSGTWVPLGKATSKKKVSYPYYCDNDNFFYGLGGAGIGARSWCINNSMPQGHCPKGFNEILYLGEWGYCRIIQTDGSYCANYFLPPGGTCSSTKGSYTVTTKIMGKAFVCSQQ